MPCEELVLSVLGQIGELFLNDEKETDLQIIVVSIFFKHFDTDHTENSHMRSDSFTIRGLTVFVDIEFLILNTSECCLDSTDVSYSRSLSTHNEGTNSLRHQSLDIPGDPYGRELWMNRYCPGGLLRAVVLIYLSDFDRPSGYTQIQLYLVSNLWAFIHLILKERKRHCSCERLYKVEVGPSNQLLKSFFFLF
ncbi:hypothetical protein Tco_0885206 [Tanacetum coccineum]